MSEVLEPNVEVITPEERPVLIITDKDGYLIQAGDPSCVKPKELAKYAKQGCEIKTITITEYRQSQYVWIYDKPKTS